VTPRRLGALFLVGVALLSGACGATPASPADPSQFIEVPGLGSTRIDVPRPTTEVSACTVALPQAFDQTAFVMALTEDEREALEARGWCFD
jgi:hypothetical protein